MSDRQSILITATTTIAGFLLIGLGMALAG